jgi:hypothetical protein
MTVMSESESVHEIEAGKRTRSLSNLLYHLQIFSRFVLLSDAHQSNIHKHSSLHPAERSLSEATGRHLLISHGNFLQERPRRIM